MVDEGKTGMKFNYADLEDFRKKITYMMEHPEEYAIMCKNARKYVEDYFQWDDIMKKFDRIIERVGKNSDDKE